VPGRRHQTKRYGQGDGAEPPSGAGVGTTAEGRQESRLSITRSGRQGHGCSGGSCSKLCEFCRAGPGDPSDVVNSARALAGADGEVMTAPLPPASADTLGRNCPLRASPISAGASHDAAAAGRCCGRSRPDLHRQLVRLLIAAKIIPRHPRCAPRRAQHAAWITVDDTGARTTANGFCTQIGNAYFAWFGTTSSRTAATSSTCCAAGHGDYVINARPWPISPTPRRPGDRSPGEHPDDSSPIISLGRAS